ncbi:MAG: DUF4065 domain-containing protein [Clostridia bacterium]|nr:DUF4065 domain-containing protein [Clostridia bacterium]
MISAKLAAQCLAYFAAQDPDGERMTMMRVQKMLYFAQGHCLAEYNTPLFPDEIQAWKHGPVVPNEYNKAEREEDGSYAAYPIDDNFSIDEVPMKEFDLLLNVFVEYNKYTTSALVGLSHAADGPWFRSYSKGKNTTISVNDIADYFRKNNREIGIDAIMNRIPTEGYIENDVLVLPGRYED